MQIFHVDILFEIQDDSPVHGYITESNIMEGQGSSISYCLTDHGDGAYSIETARFGAISVSCLDEDEFNDLSRANHFYPNTRPPSGMPFYALVLPPHESHAIESVSSSYHKSSPQPIIIRDDAPGQESAPKLPPIHPYMILRSNKGMYKKQLKGASSMQDVSKEEAKYISSYPHVVGRWLDRPLE